MHRWGAARRLTSFGATIQPEKRKVRNPLGASEVAGLMVKRGKAKFTKCSLLITKCCCCCLDMAAATRQQHVRLAAATSVFAGLVLFLLLRTNSAGEQKSPGKVTLSAQLESSVGSAHSVGSAQLESSVGSAHSVGSAQLSLDRARSARSAMD